MYHKINIKQQIYDQFVYFNYIMPNCYCFAIHINDNCCNWCFDYKYTSKYTYPCLILFFTEIHNIKKLCLMKIFKNI